MNNHSNKCPAKIIFKANMKLKKGFSLIELMVVISIAAILITLAVPNFRTMIQNQRLTTTVADFFSSVLLARSEALNTGQSVTMAPMDSSDWNNGWRVYVDVNHNNVFDQNDRLVLTHGPVTNDIDKIKGKFFVEPDEQFLMYNGSGRSRSKTSTEAPRNGGFIFRLNDQNQRRIVINTLGRPEVCDLVKDTACKTDN